MFIRIVKMSFHPELIPTFLTNFNQVKDQIRNTKGVSLLELYQDKDNPSIVFTYSYWDSEEDLENYKNSALFKEVWAFTKTLFNAQPEAWSVNPLVSLP